MGARQHCGQLDVHTEELAVFVAQLATGPQDRVHVVALEEPSLIVLHRTVQARRSGLLQLTLLEDGKDEVDDVVPDVSR